MGSGTYRGNNILTCGYRGKGNAREVETNIGKRITGRAGFSCHKFRPHSLHLRGAGTQPLECVFSPSQMCTSPHSAATIEEACSVLRPALGRGSTHTFCVRIV